MKLLFDTHAFIWWDNHRARLPGRTLVTCLDPTNTRHLSIASVWEMQIKIQLGKLVLHLPMNEILDRQQRNGLRIEPVALEDVLALAELPPLHGDPFDRLIVAQARRGGFQLVSKDPQVARYDVPILW